MEVRALSSVDRLSADQSREHVFQCGALVGAWRVNFIGLPSCLDLEVTQVRRVQANRLNMVRRLSHHRLERRSSSVTMKACQDLLLRLDRLNERLRQVQIRLVTPYALGHIPSSRDVADPTVCDPHEATGRAHHKLRLLDTCIAGLVRECRKNPDVLPKPSAIGTSVSEPVVDGLPSQRHPLRQLDARLCDKCNT